MNIQRLNVRIDQVKIAIPVTDQLTITTGKSVIVIDQLTITTGIAVIVIDHLIPTPLLW